MKTYTTNPQTSMSDDLMSEDVTESLGIGTVAVEQDGDQEGGPTGELLEDAAFPSESASVSVRPVSRRPWILFAAER